jgi:hypothetical protein
MINEFTIFFDKFAINLKKYIYIETFSATFTLLLIIIIYKTNFFLLYFVHFIDIYFSINDQKKIIYIYLIFQNRNQISNLFCILRYKMKYNMNGHWYFIDITSFFFVLKNASNLYLDFQSIHKILAIIFFLSYWNYIF